jgi:hypothetical protein
MGILINIKLKSLKVRHSQDQINLKANCVGAWQCLLFTESLWQIDVGLFLELAGNTWFLHI